MTTDTTAATGILLPCPCCGDAEASISLNLADGTLKCNVCDADFDLDFVRLLISKWTRVVAWIGAMPKDK
jgi:transcription elongation factor Elf1